MATHKDTTTQVLERIEGKLDQQAKRCHDHHLQIQELYGIGRMNEKEIACIKTERRTLVWVAGLIGAGLSFIFDLFIRKS